MEALDLGAAIERLGPESTVDTLRARLRCRECGTRSHDLRIVYVGPAGRPIVFQYGR